MADAALAQITRAALLCQQRNGCVTARGGGLSRSREGFSEWRTLGRRRFQYMDCRKQRVKHCLVARYGFASRLDALNSGVEDGRPFRKGQIVFRDSRHLQKKRAVERPRRTAYSRDQCHAGEFENRTEIAVGGW